MKSLKSVTGFTLLEVLLVMAIIAGIMVGIATYSQQRMLQLREDRTVLQMQQILNAGLAYYLNKTKWPASIIDDLQGKSDPAGYLPGPSTSITIVNPWGAQYVIGNNTSNANAPSALFAVCTAINAGAASPTIATILASRLPMAYVVNSDVSADCSSGTLPTASTCTGSSCTVIATVNVPGQNLNNARSVNYVGIYNHGACVAAPKCPEGMKEQLFVAPVSVSGMNSSINEVYPIHSFTAYFVQPTGTVAPYSGTSGGGGCTGDTYVAPCPNTGSPDDKFWRVCLQIITSDGQVNYTNATAPNAGKILAITRCTPESEKDQPSVVGSAISIWSY